MKIKQPNKARQYWSKLMQSAHCAMSEGASQIARMIPYAHKDCWRRRDKNKERHERKHH